MDEINADRTLAKAGPTIGTVDKEASDTATRALTIILLFPGHMLTDHLAYGDGLVAFGFIAALARRGHRLHVIAQRASFESILPKNVTIYSTPATARRGFVERFAFIARSRVIVRRLMQRQHIDVIHQLNPVCNGMSLGVGGLGVPLVLGTYVANWPAKERAPTLRNTIGTVLHGIARNVSLRLQERGAAAFLVTSPAALSRFSSATRVADRVHWLPNGVNIEAFAPRPMTRRARNTILFLATVAKKKGIFTLLDAFEIVQRTIPSARLVIGGHGPAFGEVQHRVSKLSCPGDVEMLGRVHRGDVSRVMAECAVYCLPSFGEPYGMTVIEAMACAKPIVVADSGGVRDLVDDLGGRRVEPGNAQQLAGAIVEILASPALQERMAAHNRETAEREYDWPRVVAKLESIYDWVNKRQATR